MDKLLKIALPAMACALICALAGCARVQAPPGGPPDTIPPSVLATTPPERSLQFAGESILLEFNEYVDRSAAQNNIFISPPVKYSTDWHGRDLEIEFDEPLQPQTTYAITVGTEFADRAGNKPQQSYTLIFSTGDRLDSGVIRGRVAGDKVAGTFVFLYPLAGLQADTLNPSFTKPKYRTQVGATGAFEFQALPAGSYRLMAVGDEFRNELFDAGVDAFGTTARELSLDEGQVLDVGLRIGPALDSVRPEVYSAVSVSASLIRVEFSEALDSASVDASAFTVSRNSASVPVRSAFLSPGRRFSVNVITEHPLESGEWSVMAVAIRDSAGNTVSDTARSSAFTVADSAATAPPVLAEVPFPDSASSISLTGPFRLVWSTAINRTTAAAAIKLQKADSTRAAIDYDLRWPQDNIVDVVPRTPLAADNAYRLIVDNRAVTDILTNKGADTTIQLFFRTVDPGNYGTVSGTVVDSAGSACRYVLVMRAKDGSRQFRIELPATGPWEIKDVPPGAYTLSGFCDADGNGVYSYGQAFPYRTAERFVEYGHDLVVRPRWTMENITLTFRP